MITIPRNTWQLTRMGRNTMINRYTVEQRKKQCYRVLANLPKAATFQNSLAYRLCVTYLGEPLVLMSRTTH